MVDAWPGTLPEKFEWTGYRTQVAADSLIESEVDAGPPITRRRSSAQVKEMAGTMVLDVDQLEDLEEFVDVTVLGGSLPFTFPAQSHGSGDLLVKFKKGALPQITDTLTDEHYRVAFSLWIMP